MYYVKTISEAIASTVVSTDTMICGGLFTTVISTVLYTIILTVIFSLFRPKNKERNAGCIYNNSGCTDRPTLFSSSWEVNRVLPMTCFGWIDNSFVNKCNAVVVSYFVLRRFNWAIMDVLFVKLGLSSPNFHIYMTPGSV